MLPQKVGGRKAMGNSSVGSTIEKPAMRESKLEVEQMIQLLNDGLTVETASPNAKSGDSGEDRDWSGNSWALTRAREAERRSQNGRAI